jgi:hypothetical protein
LAIGQKILNVSEPPLSDGTAGLGKRAGSGRRQFRYLRAVVVGARLNEIEHQRCGAVPPAAPRSALSAAAGVDKLRVPEAARLKQASIRVTRVSDSDEARLIAPACFDLVEAGICERLAERAAESIAS